MEEVQRNISPPIAQQNDHSFDFHGQKIIDNFFWLRDDERKDERVLNYLNEENEYTKNMLQHTEQFQSELGKEILSRIQETDEEVPHPYGNYFYYSRTVEGQQYSISCRKKDSLDSEEEVILDKNKLAEGHSFSASFHEVSPNHQLLAYSHDTTGGEKFTLYIKDLSTGELLSDKIENTYYSREWGNDNQTLYYVICDNAHRPYKVMKHILGQLTEDDVCVFTEPDEKFFVSLEKTRDNRWIQIDSSSSLTTEILLIDANKLTEPQMFAPRQLGVEYSVSSQADVFFIVTNKDKATNFMLMVLQENNWNPGQTTNEAWQTLIPHREDIKLDHVSCFENHVALWERKAGMKTLSILKRGESTPIQVTCFSEDLYLVSSGKNLVYETNIVRIEYESLVSSESIYDYNMDTSELVLLKEKAVLGGYDKTQYTSKRVYAPSYDGTLVPVSLVYRNDKFKNDSSNPAVLYGYGSYGHSIEPYFNSKRLSLIDRGFVWVIAHIRGGGEMGRPWYDNGKFLNKKNTFHDFIAAAKFIIAEKYTDSSRLVAWGASAGGLLMGAVANMEPDLFHAMIANVPFVDVINTMLDPTIPLTVPEYEEWGNPEDKEYGEYMLSYSPYDNVKEQRYPNLFIISGLHDSRVQYWEPTKWVAKLRSIKSGDEIILLKTNMEEGHGGASGRYDAIKEMALIYAFILDQIKWQE